MIELRPPGSTRIAGFFQTLARLSAQHPGEHRLVVTAHGRELTLPFTWTFDAEPETLAALRELGEVTVR